MTDTELLQKTVDESGIPVAVLCRNHKQHKRR
nr:MAG TPA: hypothetical protein [Ackermannviridae sp.]